MRILYGVQGTGNGHITRARALSTELNKAGIEVDYIFSGRPDDQYFNMEPFGSYRTFRGLTFATSNGQIQYIKTALTNNLYSLYRDIRSLDLSHYDLVITDFDPVSAWAAQLQNIPSLAIGHQYAFKYDIPVKGGNWLAKAILKKFAPADTSLGIHWYHFDTPVLPPLVEPPLENMATRKKMILVYLLFENIEHVCQWLAPKTDYEFYIYHSVEEAEDRGHIHLRPLSRDRFQHDLARCEGVITNSGFELASEALQYGKKILTRPIKGQMEQISNSEALKILNKADVIDSFDNKALHNWLLKEGSTPVHYPNVASEIVNWIKSGQQESLESLSEKLWRTCESDFSHMKVNEIQDPALNVTK